MDTLKLQTNMPEIIALEFADGLKVSSKFSGDQIMFTLTDGRRAYFAPYLADKIADAGIQPGELFEICKRELTHGNRRTVEYQLRTDLEAGASSPKVNTPAPAATPKANDNAKNNAAYAAALKATAGAAHPPPAALAPPTIEGTAGAAMKLAGRIAIDAVLEVEQYAQSRGLTDFSFGAENIQKLLVTLYIDIRKGGRA